MGSVWSMRKRVKDDIKALMWSAGRMAVRKERQRKSRSGAGMESGVQYWSHKLRCLLAIRVEKWQIGKWINKSAVTGQAKDCRYNFCSHWSLGREEI